MDSQAKEHVRCLIIGSGPAGFTAAIYAARAELRPLMLTGIQVGGQLTTTTEVDNYPGYPNGRTGPEMMEDFRHQAERFGTRIVYEHVSKVDLQTSPKKVWSDNGDLYLADSVIISTGATAKYLGLESEQKFNGYGVSACAVCDGYFFRGMDVVVVGAGDTAAEEATYLANLCTHVHMLVRSDKMRASKIMQKRVLETKNITVHWNTETVEVLGDKTVNGVRIRNNQSGQEQVLDVKGFFVAIGHKPNTEVFAGQITLNEAGYILTEGKSSRTNLAGVFAAGDVQDFTYRQAVTAAGTGCMAALDAERWLKEEGLL